jgi:hypothetical protein
MELKRYNIIEDLLSSGSKSKDYVKLEDVRNLLMIKDRCMNCKLVCFNEYDISICRLNGNVVELDSRPDCCIKLFGGE